MVLSQLEGALLPTQVPIEECCVVSEPEILAKFTKVPPFCFHLPHDTRFLSGPVDESVRRKTYVSIVVFIPSIRMSVLKLINLFFVCICSLVRLHTKVNKSLNQLETFIFSEWKFHNPKALRLQTLLSEEDKEKFYLDLASMEWESYFHDLTVGVRTYLNNEKLTTLKSARVKDKVLVIMLTLVTYN